MTVWEKISKMILIYGLALITFLLKAVRSAQHMPKLMPEFDTNEIGRWMWETPELDIVSRDTSFWEDFEDFDFDLMSSFDNWFVAPPQIAVDKFFEWYEP